jgi:HD-GYP domain-containing protein (c-di-GMP phosphodiesterase class II)
MILGKSLFNERGDLLLSAGHSLTDRAIERIRESGFGAAYIKDPGTESVVPGDIISDEARGRAMHECYKTEERIRSVTDFRQAKPNELRTIINQKPEFHNLVDMEGIYRVISTIVTEVDESDASILNTFPIKSHRSYGRQHAVDTALVSTLIGRQLHLRHRELLELAIASCLHDIGKQVLPQIADRLPVTYTEEETLQMREHPVYSHLLIRRSANRFFMAQAAVLYHHEREDGLGYPLGIQGRYAELHDGSVNPIEMTYPLAEIIAAADAYDNYISGRYDGIPKTPEESVRAVVNEAGTAFKSYVVQALKVVIPVFPTGSVVRILDCSSPQIRGSEAVVKHPNTSDCHRPTVVLLKDANGRKIPPKTVNLAAQRFARLELRL